MTQRDTIPRAAGDGTTITKTKGVTLMHRLSMLFGALLALALGGLTATATLAQGATPAAGDVVHPAECPVHPRTPEFFQQLAATPGADQATPGGTVAGSPTAFAQPQGEPADQATVDAVTATYRELVACLNAGDYLRAYALYTDDYLRRNLNQEGIERLQATPVPIAESTRIGFGGLRDVVMLPDGRVGALATVTSPAAGGAVTTYTVFAQVGERWLIDEETAVDAPDTGTPAAFTPDGTG